jgi:hypothetical protein
MVSAPASLGPASLALSSPASLLGSPVGSSMTRTRAREAEGRSDVGVRG